MQSDNETLPPTPESLKKLLAEHNLTGNAAAKMMYLSGGRQVRKLTSTKNPVNLSRARWFCLIAHLVLTKAEIERVENAMEYLSKR